MDNYKGIDVSTHQKSVDWAKLKADGVQFAFIRCGYGSRPSQKDKMFENHYHGAKAMGMPLGVYHYSYANTPELAVKEAECCLEWIKDKTFEYPVVFDMEEADVAELGKEKVSAIADAFCSKIEENGYYVMIYANKHWLTNYFTEKIFEKYDIWLAQYNDEPTFDGAYGIWQYTSSGKVDGIPGNVDMNIAYKDYASIIKNAGLNGINFVKKPEKNEVNTEKNEIASKTVDELANEVLDGKYGTGAARKKALGDRYAEVQARVNEILYGEKDEDVKDGDKLILKDKPLYANAYADKAFKTISGTYYIYDGDEINGRYRITNSKDKVNKKPVGSNVTGFIKI